jgi:prophage maintenance system killer protein
VALATAAVFLAVNGLVLVADDAELERLTLGVAEGSSSKDEVIAFFRDHTRAA